MTAPFQPIPYLASRKDIDAATPEQRADWEARWWEQNSGAKECLEDDRIDRAIHGSNHEWCV